MLDTLLWYLTIQAIGLAALPLTMWLFRNLPDRGYAFARPLGLFVIGYSIWLGTSFGLLRFERVTLVVLLLALAGVGVVLWRREPLRDVLRRRRAAVMATELLFAGGLVLFAWLRSYSPEIATAGGEKYMEMAFVNSILRSDVFPPADPWLSGFAISYYYFGYVLMASMIYLSGVKATVGFNLSLALLFALTVTGAFGVVYNLTPRKPQASDPQVEGEEWEAAPAPPSPVGSVGFGLLGALFVAVMGNLQGCLEVLHARGLGSPEFWAWLDIKDINVPPPAGGDWMPDRFIWWWRASRVITDRVGGNINEVIDEFPAFSFLLGDNHPHLLALPFVLLAVALAVNILRQPPGKALVTPANLDFWRERLVPALLLGALGFLNSWDFPTYTAVYVGAYAIQSWVSQGRRGWLWVADVVMTGLVVGLIGLLLYLPFWIGLRTQASGLAIQGLVKTRLPQYVVMFGPFILVAMAFLAAQVGRVWARRAERDMFVPALYVGAVCVPIIVVLLFRGWWTAAFLTLLIGLSLASMLVTIKSLDSEAGSPETERRSPVLSRPSSAVSQAKLQNPTLHTLFVLLLFAVGFALTLSTEFVFIRDNFNSRMNTVFKFYFQAWVLLALASAYAAWWLLARARVSGARRVLQLGFAATLALVVGMGMVYPVLANYTRANNFAAQPTLDGAAWVAQQRPDDYAAIQWLNANVRGQPFILEAPGDAGKSYVYEGRVATFTGLPTALGWGGHQSQWRGNYNEPGRREPQIIQLYQTTDPRQAQQILDAYNIEYVVVGSVERERFGRGPQAQKFDRFMDPVFRSGDTVIYQRR